MPFMPCSQARTHFRRRAIPVLIAATAAHFLIRNYFAHHMPSQPVALLLASLPPLFMLLLYALIVQFLNSDRDEVQLAYRRHAITWATAGTLAVCLLWGGLAEYKVVPDESLVVVLIIFVVALLIALLALRRRYQ
jgi:quinol-cytochrome oxidoreductase complex cytochrome b subunit